MAPRLNITGVWPSPITMARGWSRAAARPWCDDPGVAMLRLLRGGSPFLAEATRHLMSLGVETVYSPPLYRSSSAMWRRSGYEERHRLHIMERALSLPIEPVRSGIATTADPPWDQIVRIDRSSFQGLWRMSEPGLREAVESTRVAAILLAGAESRPDGYALVGTQWGVSYLHRIAVDPAHRKRGTGTDLVRAAVAWARGTLASVMMLNVRPANEDAVRIYEREGFTATGTDVHLLGYGA